MPESREHSELVALAIRYAKWRLSEKTAVLILDDQVATARDSRPPRIGGYVPDVFAADVPTTYTVLGEAKTAADIESPRTALQLEAFLAYLRFREGVVVLTVPPFFRRTAENIASSIALGLGVTDKLVVLDCFWNVPDC